MTSHNSEAQVDMTMHARNLMVANGREVWLGVTYYMWRDMSGLL